MICKKCKHYKPDTQDLTCGGWCEWASQHRYDIPVCFGDFKRINSNDPWRKCPTFESKPKEQKP